MRGVAGNVLSGEISVAAVRKMMLHARNVKPPDGPDAEA
jgi:hypothetical protein